MRKTIGIVIQCIPIIAALYVVVSILMWSRSMDKSVYIAMLLSIFGSAFGVGGYYLSGKDDTCKKLMVAACLTIVVFVVAMLAMFLGVMHDVGV